MIATATNLCRGGNRDTAFDQLETSGGAPGAGVGDRCRPHRLRFGTARPTGARARRGRKGGPVGRVVQGCRRGLLPRHGRRREARDGRGPGAQHLDCLDRRQRSVLGPHSRPEHRHLRPVEDGVVPSGARLRPAQSLRVPGRRQRTLLHRADRPRPESLWPVARRARSEVSARSVRQRGEVSRREARLTRHDHARRLLLRRALRHRRTAAVPQSRLRREGAAQVERRALLQRPRLLRRPRPREAVPRRHVVRVLPRRAEPGAAAEGCGEPGVVRAQLERRRAVLVGGSHLQLASHRQQGQLLLPAAAHVTPRLARHLAGLERQHQQPADDERGLHAEAASRAVEALAQGDPLGREPRQQAVQRLRACRPSAGAVLREAQRRLHAARAEGRLRFSGSARRAQPRVPQHRPLQRGVAAAFPAGDWRRAHHPDPHRRRGEELEPTGEPPRRRR